MSDGVDLDGAAAPDRGGVRPNRRPRRERGLTESLLSIMLVLEICMLFFVILNVVGTGRLSAGVAWGAGLAAIVVMALISRTLRYRWGIILGCAVQAGLILCGMLVTLTYVVAGIFVALWIFCLWKGITVDRRNAAYRAWLAANPDADPQLGA